MSNGTQVFSSKTWQQLWGRYWRLYGLTLLLTASSALLAHYKPLQSLNWLWFDRTQYASQLPQANDIIIVEIDEKSIQALGRWPWPREQHAQLLQALVKHDTASIVFDVIFADPDVENPLSDVRLAQAIAAHGQVLLPIHFEQLGPHTQALEIPPFPALYQAVNRLGHVHVVQDSDGVVRSINLKAGVGEAYWPHLSLALYQSQHPQPIKVPGQTNANTHESAYNIAHSNRVWLPMPAPDQGITHYSYVDVLRGNIGDLALQGKTLFIGATAPGLGDIFTTSIGAMTGVELNAWAYQALRGQGVIEALNDAWVTLINGLLVCLGILLFQQLSPRAFLAATVSAALLLLASSALLQNHAQLWLPLLPAVVCLVLFYPLWSWLRLELALSFLHRELDSLQRTSNIGLNPMAERQTQQFFWDTLGLPHDTQTTFAQLTRHSSPPTQTWAGTELVEQTIAQLTIEKDKAASSQRLIHQSLAKLQDGVLITDIGGQLLFSNKAMSHILAQPCTPGESLLTLLQAIELDSLDDWPHHLCQLLSSGHAITLQGAIPQHRDGHVELLCQCHFTSIHSTKADTLIFTFINISDLKAAERARTEALSFLSHDLRAPMVSVLAILEMQREHTGKQSHETPTGIETVFDDIEVLVKKNLSYAEDFLQLSRAKALQENSLQPCDLHGILDSAQMQGMALASSKRIRITSQRIDDDAWVLGEQDLLERALTNLISNAIKYSPANTEIELRLAQVNDHLSMSVQDQGDGIAAQAMPTLFDPFTRANQQHQHSAGLGLNFVATVAKKHHGRVQVQSELGKGSCFTLLLPPYLDE